MLSKGKLVGLWVLAVELGSIGGLVSLVHRHVGTRAAGMKSPQKFALYATHQMPRW